MQKTVYDWGTRLTQWAPRIPGTVSMDRSRDFIVSLLESFGLETWLDPIRFRGVFFHDWGLDVEGMGPVCAFPQNNVGFGSVQAEVVDAGRGLPADYQGKDVRGKIVLVDWGDLTRHEIACGIGKRYPLLATYDTAVAHGAAGMIGYFQDTPGNSLKLMEPGIRPTGGSNVAGVAETGEDRQFFLPALCIGRKDALRLQKRIRQKPVRAALHISGKRKVSTVWTIMGRLQGSSDHAILLGSHYCTAFSGAICDTVGVTGVLELARHYASLLRQNRPKTLYFMFSGSHVWINCNIASTNLIQQHPEIPESLTAMLWLDHMSAPAANPKGKGVEERIALTSGNPVLLAKTAAAMRRHRRTARVLPLSRLWTLCEMGPFDNLGIPVMTQQALPHELLTTEDRWDRIDPETLYQDIALHRDLTDAIARLPGRMLRSMEIPGKSLFGCGTLFPGTDQPEYPDGETYVPEPSLPLYIGGDRTPVRTIR